MNRVSITCTAPYHEDGRTGGIPYEVASGGLVMSSFRCPECGHEPVSVFAATPWPKECHRCAADFEGVAEIDDEPCDSCFLDGFLDGLRVLIAEDQARRVRISRMHAAYSRRSR